MDLAELKFVVNTEQLVDAAKKIDALAVSVSKVNKPITTAALESEKLAQAQAKTALAAAKVEEANTKAAIAADKLAKAQNTVTDSSKTQMSILEKQQSITSYMSEGLSKGMATVMSYGKAAGLAADDLKLLLDTLQTQKKFSGDPFDKSLSGVTSLKNELGILKEVQRLYGSGVELTSKQVRELASDKERLMVKLREEGASLSTMKSSLRSLNSEYITLATSINKFSDAETQMIKQQKDAAKATAYLADADARLAAALAETNKALDKQATDALVKYEKALKQSGMSADEAAAKLSVAKKQFEGIADKKQADRLQYLARAISVQMGDVGISLASGMNPLLVMIQQGDQIRGAIQQAGASGKELEKAMAGAAGQIATSFLQTAQAIGGFFVNAVKSAGKAIIDLPLSVATSVFGALTGNIETSAVAFDRLKVAAISFARVGIVAVIATLAALAVEYVKVSAAEKELTKSLAMSGAALGMSTTDAIAYAESMNGVGIGTMNAMRMIGEFANTGTDASIPLKDIIKSAQDMQKYVGIASADTMKSFADISEKPVEGLIKLAKSTGNVSAETILLAEAAVKAGDNAEAARIAQKALSDSNDEVVRRMKNNMDPLQTLWMDIKSGISKAGEALYDFLKSSTMVAIFRTAWETVSVIVTEVWYVLKQTGNEISGIFSQIKAVMSGDFTGAAKIGEQMKIDAAAAREEQDKLIASILNRNKAEKETLTITEEQRQANRKAAKEIEERLKNQKAATFKLPEDTGLKDIQNKHKIAMDSINAESNKMISDNKVQYALGLKDVGDYMSEEIRLVVDFNSRRISENNSYIQKLNNAEASQLEAIKKAIAVAKNHAKTKEDQAALDKQLIDTVNSTKEAYNRLRDSVKGANEQLADKSAEAQMKAIENLGQYTKKAIEGSKEFARTLDDTAAKRKLQIELEGQLANLTGADLARVKAQIDAEQSHIAKLSELESASLKAGVALSKLTLSGLDPNDPKYKAAEQSVLAASTALEEAKSRSRQEIVQAGIDAEMLYYMQEYNKLKSSIADAITTALFDGGKAGGKKLRDVLEAELRKPITVFVNAVVNSLMGNSTGASGGNLMGNLASSFISKAAGSISIGGGSLAAAGEAFGTGFMTTLQGGSVAEAAGAYSAAGMQGVSTGLSAGAQLATAVPYVAAALVALNALGAFRTTKQVGGGISGTLGEGDINSYATMRKSGTLFRGPSYWRENRGEFSGSDALQATFADLKNSTTMMAEAIGASSDDIAGYTKKIEISFDGLTDAQIQDKIATTFKDVGNELAALVLGAGATAEQLSSLYNNVMQQRYDLETKLLELQGDTIALRERERAKIYDSNKALYDQIAALEDKKAADEEAVRAMEKLTSVTTTIVDEINRLRGVDTSKSGLEAQFAILTAQARAGDLTALAQLPEVTKGLEQIAASTAVNATDIIFARAKLAQSLQDTLGYTGGFNTSSATSMATVSAVSSSGTSVSSNVSANSSNQELLAALVTEMQGLRAEVRADVSHNAKTAKILERANQDGETLSVSATIDGGVV